LNSLLDSLKQAKEKISEFLDNIWWLREKPPIIKVKEAKITKNNIEFTVKEGYIPWALEILEKNLKLSNETKNIEIKAKIIQQATNDFLQIQKFIKNLKTAKNLIERLETAKEKIDQIKIIPKLKKQQKIVSNTIINLIFKIRDLAIDGTNISHMTTQVEKIEKLAEKIYNQATEKETPLETETKPTTKEITPIKTEETVETLAHNALSHLQQLDTLLTGEKHFKEILNRLNESIRTQTLEFSVKDIPEQYITEFINLYKEYKLEYDPNTKTIKITQE